MPYSNPVITGFHPDPSVCRSGEDYYLVTSSFEYFPGVPVFHSKDLIHWRQIGHCLTSPSQLPLEGCRPSGGIYAPTLRLHNGIYYMVTTNTTGGGNFIVSASNPAGPWSEPLWIDQGGIDPSLLFDEDGKVYFQSTCAQDGRPGILQAEIDVQTGKLLTTGRHIWHGTGGRNPEAPHLYKINGLYYLMIAEGGTEYGHMVTVARSTNPWGPFESYPGNPILTQRNSYGEIQGTGHSDLLQAADGSWWMVFLAFRQTRPMFHNLGRETFLAPVQWNEDGWPVVNSGREITLNMDVPTLPPHPWPAAPAKDAFDEPSPAPCWNWLRNPVMENYSLTARRGWLRLTGSAETLDDTASPTFLGRRQQHMCCRVSTLLDFEPTKDGEEAGLTVFYDNAHHYDIAVSMQDGQKQIILNKVVGDISIIDRAIDYDGGPVVLSITADRDQYTLSFASGGVSAAMGSGQMAFLTSEACGVSFTGVYFGLYCTGNGEPCGAPAWFDWFEYTAAQ